MGLSFVESSEKSVQNSFKIYGIYLASLLCEVELYPNLTDSITIFQHICFHRITHTLLTFWILSSHSLFCVSSAINVWCFSHFLWSCWVSSQVESRAISIFSITQSPNCNIHTYTVIEFSPSPARLFQQHLICILTPNWYGIIPNLKYFLKITQAHPWSLHWYRVNGRH